MEKTLINDGKNRQLRLEKDPVPEKMYEVRMILHNRPQGLLPFRTEETPEGLRCDYHIMGLKSLKESLEEEDTDYLYSVLFSLERLAGIFYEYLLSPDRLMLEPDTIFLKKETGMVYFCYYPGKTDTFQEALQALMEYFLKIRNPSKEEDVLLLYGLYQRSREADVTMTSLAEYWRETESRLKAEKKEEEERLYEGSVSEVRPPDHIYEDPGGDMRIYDDLGLQIPERDSPFAHWKKRNEPVIPEEAFRPYDKEPGKEDEAEGIDTVKQYIKQNYIQLAAVVLVLGFIIWFLLN